MLEQSEGGGGGGRRIAPRLIVAGVALVLVAVLLVQNSDSVQVTFLAWHLTLPLWLALGLMVLLGAGLGQALGAWRRRNR